MKRPLENPVFLIGLILLLVIVTIATFGWRYSNTKGNVTSTINESALPKTSVPTPSVTVVVQEFKSQEDMIQKASAVQDELRKNTNTASLKQMKKVHEAYLITWADDKNAYSGIYIDGQIIALQSVPLTTPTPEASESPQK